MSCSGAPGACCAGTAGFGASCSLVVLAGAELLVAGTVVVVAEEFGAADGAVGAGAIAGVVATPGTGGVAG